MMCIHTNGRQYLDSHFLSTLLFAAKQSQSLAMDIMANFQLQRAILTANLSLIPYRGAINAFLSELKIKGLELMY